MVLDAHAMRTVATLRARRRTAEVRAALLAAALVVRFALVPAAAQRTARVAGQTATGRHTVDHLTAGVLAARARITLLVWGAYSKEINYQNVPRL